MERHGSESYYVVGEGPPQGSFGGAGVPDGDIRRNLAFRNLTRARMLRLATGQKMAAFLGGRGVPLTELTPAQIEDGQGRAALGALTPVQRSTL
ncbi:MAG: hypothetical protein QOK40_3737 [Miltoncostaeaceae bacterium]|nr:hypothetical protein [Miltoncostaeaceae bacterium]